MALVFQTWRFKGEAPALQRVVEEFQSRYDGEVEVRYETHRWDLEDDHSPALEEMTGIPQKGEEHTATLLMGDIEIEILRGLHGNQLRLCYRGGEEVQFDAITGAMEALGGEEVNYRRSPEQAARLKRQVIVGYAELIAIVLAVGYLYYGLGVGPLACIGLLIAYVIVRFAIRLAISYRFLRKRHPGELTGDGT